MIISAVPWVLLVIAAVTDLKKGKIYNEWVLLGAAAGLALCFYQKGAPGLLEAAVCAILPLTGLYPFFKIGGLGAGDLKLLAVTGIYLSFRTALCCLILSFLIGGLFSLLLMLKERDFIERMGYLLSYFHDWILSGQWKRYTACGGGMQGDAGRIHFALPVLISFTLHMGGLY